MSSRLLPQNVDKAIRNLRLGTKTELYEDLWLLIDAYEELRKELNNTPERIDLTNEVAEIKSLIKQTKRLVKESESRPVRVNISKDSGWDDFAY